MINLLKIWKILKKANIFPPDPTEKSASIGGVVANCASGSRTFHYGPARNFITEMGIVLADSSVIELERDASSDRALGNSFSIRASSGKIIKGNIPDIKKS